MQPLRGFVRGLPSRAVLWRIRRRGIDLSQLPNIPPETAFPLERDGLDPVPLLADVRDNGALHRLKLPFGFNAYLVTGFDEVREVLTDRNSYSNDIRHLFTGGGAATGDDIGGLGFTDPPLHTRLRKLITPEFTMRRLARLEPLIEQVVERQLDELEAAGPGADLAEHLAFPVPFQTICDLLGMPSDDRATFWNLGSARFDATNGAAAAFGAMTEQRTFLFDQVAKQRLEPGPGLIGQILAAEGDAISDPDLGGLADGVFTGGFETTAGMIALSTIVLTRDQRAAKIMREGTREEVDRLVDELLRYLTVVQVAFPRFAKQDMKLFGQHIKAGDVLLCSLTAANRDADWAGPAAEEVDPFRVPKTGHLAFGHGMHRCIGAELARMELRITLPALVRRFPDLALAVDESEIEFRRLSFVYGVESLPVTFTPSKTPVAS